MAATDDLHFATARDLVGRLARRELSARELLAATLARIEAVNPTLNAVVTLCPDLATVAATAADEAAARGDELGPLHGLPVAHKDLVNTAGIRTTRGSVLFADHVPDADDLIVERIRAAGAITVGKTNTPEFGAGSQTFNEVFGATVNPYDTAKTCGGSSGGAAVALAAGMVPIADGSDMGGSLRNPAGFCNVFGFRPSPGRVPGVPAEDAWSNLGVLGPMARNPADAALLLSAIAGPDPRSPLSWTEPGAAFAVDLGRELAGVPVAWSDDLGLPVDRRVRAALAPVRAVLDGLGCLTTDATPDLSGGREAFHVLRAAAFAGNFAVLSDEQLERCKDTVQWNVGVGRELSAVDLMAAQRLRTTLYVRMQQFMAEYEFLVAPVSQVPPFDVTTDWVREVDGEPMETYIDWMQSCSLITLTGLPAASVPVGFTTDGLPVGLQVVGRWGDDLGVLQLAHALDEAVGASIRRPPDPA